MAPILSGYFTLDFLSLICDTFGVEVKQREVIYYEDSNGKQPVRDWLAELKDLRGAAKIDVRIRRAGLGNFGDHKSVGDSVIELRIPFGPGYRVYLSIVDDKVILLLLGGDKSTQSEDIKEAKVYLKNWRENEKK